jgi:surfactin synthase thioesterase subunit
MSTDWVVTLRPNPAADVQLVCVPNAGAGMATFAGWQPRLPSWVELALAQLPGRDGRRGEPCGTSVAGIADALAAAVGRLDDRPRVLFGHSMGAAVAFETARRLQAAGRPIAALAASGRRGPSVAERLPPIAGLPMDAFVAEVQRRYGGIPAGVLDEPELRELLLPTLRADVQVVEAYRYAPGDPLTCPVLAYGGADDPHAPLDELRAWCRETTGACHVRRFAGGHFYLQDRRDELVAALVSDLGDLRRGRVPRLSL